MKNLKWLCKKYKESSDSIVECCNARSNYLIANKDNFIFETLDECDLVGLRPYLLCDILAIYEYLAIKNSREVDDWFYKYNNLYCPKEVNDEYLVLKLNPLAPQNADIIFDSMLERSIEPFKSRGIPADCFDYTV